MEIFSVQSQDYSAHFQNSKKYQVRTNDPEMPHN